MNVYIVKIYWMNDVSTPDIKIVADTDEETLWKTVFRKYHRNFDWSAFEKSDLDNIEKALFDGQYRNAFYQCLSADKFKTIMTVSADIAELLEPVTENMNYCKKCRSPASSCM